MHVFISQSILCVLLCHQGTEGKEEQSVGSHTAQQFSPPGRSALFHHHQPQPTGPRQEEDLSTVVSSKNQLRLLEKLEAIYLYSL